MVRQQLLRVAAAALVALAAVACAAGPASSPAADPPTSPGQPAGSAPAAAGQSDVLQAMVEAARKEGQLILVWGGGTMGGSEGVRRLAAGFNKY